MTTTVVKPTAIAGSTWCNSGCIYPPALRMRFETYSVYVMSSTRWKSGKTPVPDACSSVLCQTNSCQASGHESSMSSFRRTLYLRVCAVAAIHRGKLPSNHPKSNPHVHIIVSTRTVGPEGFNPKKDREHNQRSYIEIWRRAWARVQNRAYERCHVKKRVSHESLRVQGVERKPTRHVSYVDLQRGERQRRIQAKELARELARLERNRELSREKTKTHSR